MATSSLFSTYWHRQSRKGGKGLIFFLCKKVGTVFTSAPASDNLHLESGRKVLPTPLPRENLETSFFYGSFIRLLGRRGAKIWPNFPPKKERIASRLRRKSVRQLRPQLGPGRNAIASELGNREENGGSLLLPGSSLSSFRFQIP